MERLRDEQTEKFLGTASIRLEVLDFSLTHDTRLPGSDPDWDNVESLGGLFLNGISFAPHQISHQIPALIDQTRLNEALNNANIAPERLKRNDVEIVELNLATGSRVHCLRGQDRVLAAMRVAEDMNRRWVIRLYQQDLSLEAIKDLKDERSSEKEPSDAELLYWTTRFWLEHEDSLDDHQNKWLAHLARKSKSKAAGLQRLWTNHAKYKNLIREFEKTPALFGGAQLGNISRWISAPDKMNVNQMKRVLDFWRDICDSNDNIKSRLSTRMLEEVGGKTPGSSKKHDNDIQDMASKILRNFENNERQDILKRLRYATRDRLVPTFSIFIKNIGYLKEVVGCLRHLVSGTPQNIRKNLDDAFRKRNPCMLQVADNRCKWVEAGEINQKELAYRQLWLFALREHPSISQQIERKKAAPKYFIDESKLYQFALLAQELGYCTPQITAIMNRPRMILPSMGEKSLSKTPGDSSNYSDGKPLSKDQEEHKHSLFLENIHKPFNPECPGSRFFFSQRSLYLDVFGDEFSGIENFLNAAALCDEQSLGDEALQVDKWKEAAIQKDIQELLDIKTKLEEEVQQLRKSVTSEGEDAQSMRSQFWEMANKVKEKEESLEDISQNIEVKKKEDAELFESINKKIEKLESVQSRLREDEQREQDSAERLRTQEEKERDLESRVKSLEESIETLDTKRCNAETILQLQKDKEELEEKMDSLKEGIDAPRQDQHTETTTYVECQPSSSTQLEIKLNFQESTEIVKVGKRVLSACLETFSAKGYSFRDDRGGYLMVDTCFDVLRQLLPQERIIRLIDKRNKRKYALLESRQEGLSEPEESTSSRKKPHKSLPYEKLVPYERLTAKELLGMYGEKRDSAQSKVPRGHKGISTRRKHT